jgi:hypothetical protein
MSAIDLGTVRMKSAAAMSLGQATRAPGALAIRLRPVSADEAREIGMGTEAIWAWAVVYETKGDSVPDALLVGGVAPTQDGAAAMAHEEYRRQEAIIARRKGVDHGKR